jgi:hypothetical protein
MLHTEPDVLPPPSFAVEPEPPDTGAVNAEGEGPIDLYTNLHNDPSITVYALLRLVILNVFYASVEVLDFSANVLCGSIASKLC